jgi:signal transduction histidine kinase
MQSCCRNAMRSRAFRANPHIGLIARTVKSVWLTSGCSFDPVALNLPSPLFRISVPWSHFIWIAPIFLIPAFLLGWLVGCLWTERLKALRNLRFRNQLLERTRIARDLNETLLQTIEASKMVADDALDRPADAVRMRRTMSRLSDWLGQAAKESQQALDSLGTVTSENSDMTAKPLSQWILKLFHHRYLGKKKRH